MSRVESRLDSRQSKRESKIRTELDPNGTKNPFLADEFKEEDAVVQQPKPTINLKPTYYILGFAFLGLIIGISLSNGRGSPELISWFKLPGDLFIRSLKCVVLPLVFVNIILAVVDMIRAGKAVAIAGKTFAIFAFTTVLSTVEGLIFVLMFESSFSRKDPDEITEPEIKIKCPMNDFSGVERYLVADPLTGLIQCLVQNVTDFESIFEVDNVNDFLIENEDENAVTDDYSFSETIQDGIFRKAIPDNIVKDFIDANFVGVIAFAIVFGASSQSLKRTPTRIIELLEESSRIFLKIIDWIIYLTPIAVLSLVAGNIGEQDDLVGVFKDIGVLFACTALAMSFHFFIVYQLLFWYFVRQNPFRYLQFIFPAQMFAFASASSAATLPVTLDCIRATKEVPESVANFVLSMGSTLNMDGGAIYFPTAIVFLAIASGLEDQLDITAYLLIILLSTIGSSGTAPVPSASLVLIITAYNTVFSQTGTPEVFGILLAIDWLMDRMRTLVNVTGDAYICRIVAELAKAKNEDDVLLNRAVEGEKIRSIYEHYQ